MVRRAAIWTNNNTEGGMDKAGAGRGAEIREPDTLEGTERRNLGDGSRIYINFHMHLLAARFPPPFWIFLSPGAVLLAISTHLPGSFIVSQAVVALMCSSDSPGHLSGLVFGRR